MTANPCRGKSLLDVLSGGQDTCCFALKMLKLAAGWSLVAALEQQSSVHTWTDACLI